MTEFLKNLLSNSAVHLPPKIFAGTEGSDQLADPEAALEVRMRSEVGTQLDIDNWFVKKILGKGAYSSVYLVEH